MPPIGCAELDGIDFSSPTHVDLVFRVRTEEGHGAGRLTEVHENSHIDPESWRPKAGGEAAVEEV